MQGKGGTAKGPETSPLSCQGPLLLGIRDPRSGHPGSSPLLCLGQVLGAPPASPAGRPVPAPAPVPAPSPAQPKLLPQPRPQAQPPPSAHRVKREQVCSQMPLTTPSPAAPSASSSSAHPLRTKQSQIKVLLLPLPTPAAAPPPGAEPGPLFTCPGAGLGEGTWGLLAGISVRWPPSGFPSPVSPAPASGPVVGAGTWGVGGPFWPESWVLASPRPPSDSHPPWPDVLVCRAGRTAGRTAPGQAWLPFGLGSGSWRVSM